MYIISGIQQLGIGVADMEAAWAWYRRFFGMDVPVFQEAAEAPYMTRYTGDKVQSRTATLAVNLQGGGGFEIWQYTSRDTRKPDFEVTLGDLGIFAGTMKSPDPEAAYDLFAREGVELLGPVTADPAGRTHFFLRDPFGNIFQIVESDTWFSKPVRPTGGPSGCVIGVGDIDAAMPVYRDILGYDKIIYDEEGTFDDLALLPGGTGKFRRCLVTHSVPRKGAFSKLLGKSTIEIVTALDREPKKIFRGRFWGDAGFIHLCFDVHGMRELGEHCTELGFPFTADSRDSFDMGEASGHFSYIEDPDGTLIEFVETHKIPIMKKWNWYLDLTKRNPKKSLPGWMLGALKFGRKKD